MNTSIRGHWYICQNAACGLKIPLPDHLFDDPYDFKVIIPTECKCGRINLFSYSHAEKETEKPEVDKYFEGTDPGLQIASYWQNKV
jgi:hypothetical protein